MNNLNMNLHIIIPAFIALLSVSSGIFFLIQMNKAFEYTDTTTKEPAKPNQ